MPDYRLTDVEADLRNECVKSGTSDLLDRFPKLPEVVGGETQSCSEASIAGIFPSMFLRWRVA